MRALETVDLARRRRAPGGRVLARHAPARQARPGARPRPRPAAAGRATERPRPGPAQPRDRDADPAGRGGAHDPRLLARTARGGADGTARAGAGQRPTGGRGLHRRHPAPDQRTAAAGADRHRRRRPRAGAEAAGRAGAWTRSRIADGHIEVETATLGARPRAARPPPGKRTRCWPRCSQSATTWRACTPTCTPRARGQGR